MSDKSNLRELAIEVRRTSHEEPYVFANAMWRLAEAMAAEVERIEELNRRQLIDISNRLNDLEDQTDYVNG